MDPRRTSITDALQAAPQIQAAGRETLLAIAARALDAQAPFSCEGIARALDLHPCLVVAILVASDLAGDTNSRRELGLSLFSRLRFGSNPTELSERELLVLAAFCLEQLRPLDQDCEGLVAQGLALVGSVLSGRMAELPAVRAIEDKAISLQQTKVVLLERNQKTKLSIPAQEQVRRRVAQALRALLQDLLERPPSPYLISTVAGESAGALFLGLGSEAAMDFCVALSEKLAEHPALG